MWCAKQAGALPIACCGATENLAWWSPVGAKLRHHHADDLPTRGGSTPSARWRPLANSQFDERLVRPAGAGGALLDKRVAGWLAPGAPGTISWYQIDCRPTGSWEAEGRIYTNLFRTARRAAHCSVLSRRCRTLAFGLPMRAGGTFSEKARREAERLRPPTLEQLAPFEREAKRMVREQYGVDPDVPGWRGLVMKFQHELFGQ